MSDARDSSPDATQGATEADLVRRARELSAQGEREGAAWAWYRAATLAFERGDTPAVRAATQRAIDAAHEALGPLDRPRLRASLDLLSSELAADAGDPRAAAELSLRAEQRFMRAGDADGVAATRLARALRGLRIGDGERGLELARELLAQLDRADGAVLARIWLRLYAARWLLAAERPDDALALAAAAHALAQPGAAERPDDALALAAAAHALAQPGTGEHLAASAALVRALLDTRAFDRAASIATDALAVPGQAPPALRAELYLLNAAALRGADNEPLAQICVAMAEGLSSPGITEARRRYGALRYALGRALPSAATD